MNKILELIDKSIAGLTEIRDTARRSNMDEKAEMELMVRMTMWKITAEAELNNGMIAFMNNLKERVEAKEKAQAGK